MPRIAPDRQRSRVRLHPVAEAGARVGLAWLRNQHDFRARRPLPRFLARTLRFLSLAHAAPTVVTEMVGGLTVEVSTRDRTIARSVYASGDWDPLLVGSVFAALDEYGFPYRGRTFLEIGANFGVYSLPAVAAHGFARAVAYEPDPSSFELLVRNIRHNGLEDRLAAHNVALSAAPGELRLKLGTSNAGDNRIVGTGAVAADASTVLVPARTLDDEVAAGRIPLDELGLVWLDVQGHEAEVLAGAKSLLARRVPLVVEYATTMLDPRARLQLEEMLAGAYEVMVDLGWSALTDRVRFQPAWAVRRLAAQGGAVETDLLFLPGR
jgi:FkbM family methyltransferase